MTYPDARVAEAVTARFVPLKLDLFQGPREVLRPLGVIWTPTILFADRRGAVHYRSVNFLPPDLFLALLDLGEASVDLHWSRTDHAIDLLRGAYERDPDGALAPEVLYWWGIAVYLKTHSNDAMYRVWDRLRERFPDSIWAARVP
ncbi:MAG: thioredoxin family protein [Thermomicrobiaceae bacterium]|nr:thioredoxin family protein [Thermomicrobiaceae bacterium]